MDENKYLILINDEDKTGEVEKILSVAQSKIEIKFHGNDKLYTYCKDKVLMLENPKSLDINSFRIYRGNICLFKMLKILDFGMYLKVFYENGQISLYSKHELRLEYNALIQKKS